MVTILLHDITYLSSKNPGQGSATTTGISNAPAGSLDTPSKRRGWDRWAVSKMTSPIQKGKQPVFTPVDFIHNHGGANCFESFGTHHEDIQPESL